MDRSAPNTPRSKRGDTAGTSFLWVVKHFVACSDFGFKVLSKAKIPLECETRWTMKLAKCNSTLCFVLSPDDENTEAHVTVKVSVLAPDFRESHETSCSCYLLGKRSLELTLKIDENDARMLLNGTNLVLTGRIGVTRLRPSQDKEILRRLVSRSLSHDMDKLLRRGEDHDVKLVVMGREFRCHKGVLACRSTYFRKFFEEEKDKFVINNMDVRVFEKVLKYIYTGEMDFIHEEELGLLRLLVIAATRYELEGLKALCESNLLSHMNSRNVLDMYVVAVGSNLRSLKRRAPWMFMIFGNNNVRVTPRSSVDLSKTPQIPVVDVWCITDNFITKGVQRFKELSEGSNCQSVTLTDDTKKFHFVLSVHFETRPSPSEAWKLNKDAGSPGAKLKRREDGLLTLSLTVISSAATAVEADYRFSFIHANEMDQLIVQGSRRSEVGRGWDVAQVKDEEFPACLLTQGFSIKYEIMIHRSFGHEAKAVVDDVSRLGEDFSSIASRVDYPYIYDNLQFVSLAYEQGSEALDPENLMTAACNYRMEALQTLLVKHLVKNLSVSNVVKMYKLSQKCNIKSLEKSCIEFIAKNYGDVFSENSSEEHLSLGLINDLSRFFQAWVRV